MWETIGEEQIGVHHPLSDRTLLAGRGTNDGEADGEESEHEGQLQGNGSTRLRRQRTQNESDLGVIDMVDLCPYR